MGAHSGGRWRGDGSSLSPTGVYVSGGGMVWLMKKEKSWAVVVTMGMGVDSWRCLSPLLCVVLAVLPAPPFYLPGIRLRLPRTVSWFPSTFGYCAHLCAERCRGVLYHIRVACLPSFAPASSHLPVPHDMIESTLLSRGAMAAFDSLTIRSKSILYWENAHILHYPVAFHGPWTTYTC